MNLSKLKPYLKYVPIALVGLFLVLWIGSCFKARDLTDDYSILKGKEEILRKQLEAKDKLLKKAEADYEERINYLNGNLDSYSTLIWGLQDDVDAEKLKVVDLKKKLAAVPAGDLSAENAILKGINETQGKLIVKMELQIAKLGPPREVEQPDGTIEITYPPGTITWNLNQMYLESVYRGDKWRDGYQGAVVLLEVRARIIKDIEKDLKRCRMWTTAKTGVVVALAAAVAYGLVKK